MNNIKQQIDLILATFILAACCGTKKSDVTGNVPVYEAEASDKISLQYEEFKKLAGNKVYFTFDSSILSKEAKDILIKQAEWLKANPSIIADVEGYCDEIGTDEYNFALGLRRAKAVKNFLEKYGVEQERLKVISYGKLNPAKLGHNKEAHRANRRAVTVVIK